jgi:hypothetical protein
VGERNVIIEKIMRMIIGETVMIANDGVEF